MAENARLVNGSDKTQIHVVLFSGGSGTKSITEALIRHPQIRLQILINAYDDGHSTGRLRRFIPSMLGPSDVRKNIGRLMPSQERCHRSLAYLSDYRLPIGIPREAAEALLRTLIEGRHKEMPGSVAQHYAHLTVEQAETFGTLLRVFLQYLEGQEKQGRTFDFTDCALGNLLFAGQYLQDGEDFNRAIASFSRFYEIAPDVLLNITQGENLFLTAGKEDGTVLLGEADIVAAQSAAPISDLYLLDEAVFLNEVDGSAEPSEGWKTLIHNSERTPQINPAARDAIAQADVIIYGPGTQHSSLFPSYMTAGVAEAVAGNREADKIFVGNIIRDLDMQADGINDLARKFMYAMTRKGATRVEWRDCVNHFFVQSSEEIASDKAHYIPFDPNQFMYPTEGVRVRNWEASGGRHSGGFVLDEVRQIVQSRIDIELQRMQHMISIIVPVLDEAKTLEPVLKSLLALDFSKLGLTKEVIVVDGGSKDGSDEIAAALHGVQFVRGPAGAGRGAALRAGIDKSRGSIIAFFPGDREYRTEELFPLVDAVVTSRFQAVFGTRATKVRDVSEQLKTIYSGKRILYLTSKYGGMLLSILTLLLYNRYVSDVLTSVKVFDAELLRRLGLERNGRDLDAEIAAKLGLLQTYILELPVEYTPRTRSEGKKITLRDGLQCLSALIRYRIFSRAPRARQAPAEESASLWGTSSQGR